jgi:hypothetical protein
LISATVSLLASPEAYRPEHRGARRWGSVNPVRGRW